jgi:ABC transporter substrate binding protein
MVGMERREFITLLGGAAAAWPLTVRYPALQPFSIPRSRPPFLPKRVGGAHGARFSVSYAGWVTSKEPTSIERYSPEGHHERYAAVARKIVNRSPDVIVTGTNPVVTIFQAATSAIPIVAFMLDPLKAGLVTSLNRPGGNLTGITLDPGIEIWGKRLEMLKEAIPSTSRAVVLGMREGWEGSSGQALRDAAGRLGISLVLILPEQGTPSELEKSFVAIEKQRPDAVLVSGEGDLSRYRDLIITLAARHKRPAVYGGRWSSQLVAGGGGFRSAAVGGFRGGAIRSGFGRVGVAGLGFRGPVVGRGIRVAGFRGGGFRRGWGWDLPLAGLGLGLGYYGYPYYSSYYSDPCVEWDGYTWVNICY